MIEGLKPYPEYKDSGVAWLGAVPGHWEVKRNKLFLREINERSEDGSEDLLTVSQYTGVTRRRDGLAVEGELLTNAASLVGYKRVRQNDLVMNIMLAWNASLGVSAVNGIASPAYCVYRAKGSVDPRFIHYLFRTPLFTGAFKTVSTGVVDSRLRLYPDVFFSLPSPLPPLPEQSAIVRFLDHADRRIRRYIRAKQKLIKLLEEQKQAIIHRAVTRGLDHDVRLKPSGVEWLGEVPEHWEVAALRHRYSQCLGKMLDSKRITGRHPRPYLRNTDVQWDRINVENLPTMDIPPAEYSRYIVQPGDLLVCEGGDVGRCAIWSGAMDVCGYQKALHRLRPLNPSRDVPRFMYFALRAAAKCNAFNDGHLSTIAHLTGDKLRAHRFPFPPVAEQELLVTFLDYESRKVDQAISTAHREISLFHEYRTRLIADVVTGKLDVRSAAGSLSEEVEAAPDDAEPLAEDEEPTDETAAEEAEA
jgi:type I restriction enzyme S subunit